MTHPSRGKMKDLNFCLNMIQTFNNYTNFKETKDLNAYKTIV